MGPVAAGLAGVKRYDRAMTITARRACSTLLAVTLGTIVAAAPALGDEPQTAAEWTPFDGGPDTTCADGSEVHFLERIADPKKVVLYFEGGGACFSAETCAFDGPERSYFPTSLATPEWLADRGGIFDASDPQNPLADYSFVYVPYCTGDVHLGNRTTEYSSDLSVEHRGFVNGTAALDHLVAAYPDTSELVVAGMSGGSIPTPFYAGLAADALPEARITTLGDGSGAFPSDPFLNTFVGLLWGTADTIPDWPETEGLTVRDWGIPDLYRYAGAHAPEVTFAKIDFAYDETQSFYADLVGVAADDLLSLIDQNEADIEAAGVPVASYIAPGTNHTILDSDRFYELEVEGVRLVDWVSDVVRGEAPADVHCAECD